MTLAEAKIAHGPDVKGGLQEYLTRTLDDGTLIEFEYAPIGYLTKKGEPRKADWRAYFVTAPEGKRERRVSVTGLLDCVTSKGGLPYWFEQGGIKGAQEAHRRGLLTAEHSLDEALRVVRSEKLGAEAERDRAADRGLNVHSLLQHYMETGNAPNPSEHPEPHRGYIQALVRWLLRANPEPVAVEQLVAAPEYAGRMDLKARSGGALVSYDAKTQERGGVFLQAHAQLALYNRADRICGGEHADRSKVVVFALNGEFREMDLAITEEGAMAALAWFAHARPVEQLCEAHNRAEKKARAAA